VRVYFLWRVKSGKNTKWLKIHRINHACGENVCRYVHIKFKTKMEKHVFFAKKYKSILCKKSPCNSSRTGSLRCIKIRFHCLFLCRLHTIIFLLKSLCE
jgi:hypothetical protein